MNYETIKSVMITGANAGLGKEIARQIALGRGAERLQTYLPHRRSLAAPSVQREVSEGFIGLMPAVFRAPSLLPEPPPALTGIRAAGRCAPLSPRVDLAHLLIG
jgi:NAD(P)-dependent dehydrogenase (short-subunit alcohol dehydrogenase family)